MVKRPPDANVVDSKWVFRIKKNAAGEIDKYKARLVARGFTQIYGVDYYEMYAPVARLASFRLLMAIAACNEWPLDNFDFDQAFLNSKLGDDEVIVGSLPLEGEKCNDERLTDNESEPHQGTHQDKEPITIEPENCHISIVCEHH